MNHGTKPVVALQQAKLRPPHNGDGGRRAIV